MSEEPKKIQKKPIAGRLVLVVMMAAVTLVVMLFGLIMARKDSSPYSGFFQGVGLYAAPGFFLFLIFIYLVWPLIKSRRPLRRLTLVIWAGVATIIVIFGGYILSAADVGGPLNGFFEDLEIFAGVGFAAFVIAIYLVGPLLRLLFWTHWRPTLFGLACFATLTALFYAEEDWRGWHAWQHYKQACAAKGQQYDLADFVPPPVPDEQNFALTPIVASCYATMLDKTGHEIIPRNPNVINRLEWNLASPADLDSVPTNADWARGDVTDLKLWQAYYRNLARTNNRTGQVTNDFPVAPRPQSPAEDVLLALTKYDPALEELRAAAKLPASRFPLEYDKENPSAILLPHLGALKRCTLVIRLRAIAELRSGQSAQALADIKLNFRLMEAVHSEPFIISQLVRYAILQLNLQPIYEGLAEHQWTAAQLAELDLELAPLHCLDDYAVSIRSEPAAHIKLIDYMERKRSRGKEVFEMLERFNEPGEPTAFRTLALLYLAPKGWFYQNELRLAQLNQRWNQPMVNAAQKIVVPEMAAESKAAESKLATTPFGFLARTLLPWLGEFAQRAALAQTDADLARLALALEHSRLVHGEYPETLDALVPEFIGQLPHDVIGGGPLKYRRTGDGQFVLYSIGWNEKDDGGAAVFTQSSRESFEGFNRDDGDWVWRCPHN